MKHQDILTDLLGKIKYINKYSEEILMEKIKYYKLKTNYIELNVMNKDGTIFKLVMMDTLEDLYDQLENNGLQVGVKENDRILIVGNRLFTYPVIEDGKYKSYEIT